jgi:hypothetical protein
MRSFSTLFQDTVGDSLQAIRPGRPKYHLRTALGKHECGRFADPTACARNYDNLVFDPCHKVLPLRIGATFSFVQIEICSRHEMIADFGMGEDRMPFR